MQQRIKLLYTTSYHDTPRSYLGNLGLVNQDLNVIADNYQGSQTHYIKDFAEATVYMGDVKEGIQISSGRNWAL